MPEILGPSLANEMLLAGKQLSAAEALKARLVSAVFDTPDVTRAAAVSLAKQMASFTLAEKATTKEKINK